jgi:LysR family transcriptional regulator, glycine cleavage system transcriptional activator
VPRPSLRIPSLDFMRGFVAVGRRMNITRAAEDLCLTQSAVSRQIQALEDALGVKLFIRGPRRIEFTAEGERLFCVADGALQQLQDAVDGLTNIPERVSVAITASIGVAALWLLPRLGRIQQCHPHVDVRVMADNKLLDLKVAGADLAIRYCTAAKVPPGSTRLFGETVVPVAHASLGVQRIEAAALSEQVLIEFDDPQRPWLQWGEWLNTMGLGTHRPRSVLRFNQYDQVILAALAGHGIALGRLALVEPLLMDRRLLAVSDCALSDTNGYAYWLIQAEASPPEEVRRVISWIMTEAHAA